MKVDNIDQQSFFNQIPEKLDFIKKLPEEIGLKILSNLTSDVPFFRKRKKSGRYPRACANSWNHQWKAAYFRKFWTSLKIKIP